MRQPGQSEPHMMRSHPKTSRVCPAYGLRSSTLLYSVASFTGAERMQYAPVSSAVRRMPSAFRAASG